MKNKINRWWMALDPSNQYMYWIIAFVIMVGCAIMLLAFITPEILAVASIMLFVPAFILSMVGFFMMVVIFLTVIWPHLYERTKKK